MDELLGGGIETGTITEIFGASNTGKTQICHQLCVTTQFPVCSGGAEGCALYIDTAGTFRPKRVAQMTERYGMDTNDALDNIAFSRCYTTDHQLKLLKEAQSMMTTAHYSLVIIDSGTGLFRTEYGQKKDIKQERDHLLNEFYAELQRMCDIFKVAVVVTNQIETNGDDISKVFGSSEKGWCDDIVSFAATTRVHLRKGNQHMRIAKIVKSPNLPQDETSFCISNEGICDDS